MPDTGYRPHRDENDLVTPDDQDNSSPKPANPGDEFEERINRGWQGGQASGLRKAEQAGAKPGKVGTAEKVGRAVKGGKEAYNAGTEAKTGVGAAIAGAKAAIKSREQQADDSGGLWKGDDKKKGKKGRFSWKQKAAAGGAGALVGVGGFLGLGSISSGPLQVIHFAQLLEGFHMSAKTGQNNSRFLQQARYLRYSAKGTPEKARLGVVSRKFADIYRAKLAAKGITPINEGRLGYQEGYSINPKEYKDNGFNGNDRSPEAVQKYLLEERGYPTDIVTNANGERVLERRGTGKLFSGRAIMSETYDLAGMKGGDALVYRSHAREAGLTLHPIKAMDRAIFRTTEKITKEFGKRLREQVFRSSKTPLVTGTPAEKSGKAGPGTQDTAGQISQLETQAGEAGNGIRNGDPGALEKFSGSLKLKLAAGGAGLAAIVCVFQALYQEADKINQANIQIPLEQMASFYRSAGDQVKHGDDNQHSSPVDLDQIGVLAGKYYDAKTQTEATSARSIQAELGKPLSGPDMPRDLKTKPSDSYIAQFINGIPGINQICSAVNSPVGTVILYTLGAIVSPVGTILAGLLQLSGAPEYLFHEAAKSLAGAPVVAEAEGALLGNEANYGERYTAAGFGQSEGGVPLTTQEEATIAGFEADYQKQDFQSRSFASRMFDIQDRRSFIAQVFDSTVAPTPQDTVSKFATGFMNIGKGTLQSFGALFTAKLNAAPLNSRYDYGFPDIGFPVSDVTSNLTADPFENADAVAGTYDANGAISRVGILDGPEGPMYIERAKACFGITLQQVPDADQAGLSTWNVKPPVYGDDIPTIPYMQDPAHKCREQNNNWQRVRFFIWDTQIGNGHACMEGDKQACIDVGLTAGATTAAAGPAGAALSCIDGDPASGASIGGSGVLNNPIPANPVIDPISAQVVSKFKQPRSMASLYDYGQTVVCSGPNDPEATVTSGNPGWGPNAFDQPVAGATGTGQCNPLHIPANTPIPGGSDKWVVVIDSTKPGLACMMWIAQKNSDTSWSMAFGGVYSMSGGGMPPLAGVGTGSNIPQSPILAREIQAGVINHALAFASHTNQGGFRAPATKTDGGGAGPFVEGMRFQLDPTFDCSTIPTVGEKAVCVALQVYGAYDVDNTGGNTGWFFQSNGPKAVYDAAGITSDYFPFPNIPMDRMRLLANWEGN